MFVLDPPCSAHRGLKLTTAKQQTIHHANPSKYFTNPTRVTTKTRLKHVAHIPQKQQLKAALKKNIAHSPQDNIYEEMLFKRGAVEPETLPSASQC